ncbi:hypothetical protein [Micromonospora parathelypteridis]|uniref:Uncharacterized protein n=1 Tax=Micromonospora parathelypteridis TaxID=1839617 RepID=A0A840W591_9ACTN|nr:hypothetical protein [Micromonospora parathelypteridis]MBB5481184.1 hypothetical protein [Micromonospora parathelypteridis]GGO19692.1 hypothetical protein GCM10011576_36130 [Micromonospora parathelypteridis]
MSELDRLRHAMRATERPDVMPDLATVMREGRRLRTRRRVAGAGAATLAAGLTAVVVVVVAVGTRPDDSPTAERPPPVAVATPPTGVSPLVPTSLGPTAPPGTTGDEPAPKPLGQMIDSGVRHGTDQRVYFVVGVSVPGHPKVSVGLAAGRRALDGSLTTDILVNDVGGADRSPGFHQIGYDERSSADPVPTFGYFVGPAQRIIGTVDGRQVDARLARWSVDKQVVIFWFDPTELTPGVRLDGIIARDGKGRRL